MNFGTHQEHRRAYENLVLGSPTQPSQGILLSTFDDETQTLTR